MVEALKRKLKTKAQKLQVQNSEGDWQGKSLLFCSKELQRIPKQTLSQWVKDKQKTYATVESNSSMKKRRVRQPPYELVGKACHKWLINGRHPKILISVTVLKTKTLHFAKEFLATKNFKRQMSAYTGGSKNYNTSFKTVSSIYFR